MKQKYISHDVENDEIYKHVSESIVKYAETSD